MKKPIKKLSGYDDIRVHSESPFTPEEMLRRHDEYATLSKKMFKQKYQEYVFRPAYVVIDGVKHEVQMNFCNNPFCMWYGQPQKKYNHLKGNPSRYSFGGAGSKSRESMLQCGFIPASSLKGISAGNNTTLMSNWSVAEEIVRLIKINSTSPLKSEYQFHIEKCKSETTPDLDPDKFYKYGKSVSGYQRYKCKRCGKITTVLPTVDGRFNYHLKQDGLLIDFAKDIMSRMPVTQTCRKLGIAPKTYYHRLEMLYKRCLEFLEEYETKAFKFKYFDEIMLTSDSLIYNLNNIRLKGRGGTITDKSDKLSQIYLLGSADAKTAYAFRTDIAYDFDFDLGDLIHDTAAFHCDATFSFLRKNERLAFPFFPVLPEGASQAEKEKHLKAYLALANRMDYVQGCHVNYSYEAAAHFYLLRKMVQADKWNFITDDDPTLQSAITRVFMDKIRKGNSHYFVCQYEKGLKLGEAGWKAMEARRMLQEWGVANHRYADNLFEMATLYLEEFFETNDIFEYYTGTDVPSKCKGPIIHPLPSKSEGTRFVTIKTNVSDLPARELARLTANVNSVVINNLFQEIRRRISLLERPLVTSRGDGKSYIYANYNPKYAQYLVTIFRTLYNFCWTRDYFGERMTPAQRIGIANKVYTLKDIIYLK